MDLSADLKKLYPDLYPEVEAIFNKYDPMGFEPGVTTPQNEYDLEILELLPALGEKKDEKSIYVLLLQIFHDKFGEETIQQREKKLLKKIAAEITQFTR